MLLFKEIFSDDVILMQLLDKNGNYINICPIEGLGVFIHILLNENYINFNIIHDCNAVCNQCLK